jgi:hypothetical protein
MPKLRDYSRLLDAIDADRTRLDSLYTRKREQLKARSLLLSAEETQRLFRRRKRRAFLIGEYVLDHIADLGEAPAIMSGLDRHLTNARDRALFELGPVPDEAR